MKHDTPIIDKFQQIEILSTASKKNFNSIEPDIIHENLPKQKEEVKSSIPFEKKEVMKHAYAGIGSHQISEINIPNFSAPTSIIISIALNNIIN